MAGMAVQEECVTSRVAQITRDTGPSGALSGIAAYGSMAATPTPSGRASLTRSCAEPPAAVNPIRATVAPVAGRDGEVLGREGVWGERVALTVW